MPGMRPAGGGRADGLGVVLFDSIHDVLAAERVLRARGMWHDMVPVPRELSTDCGMAIELQPTDVRGMCGLLRAEEVRFRSVLRRVDGRWVVVHYGTPGGRGAARDGGRGASGGSGGSGDPGPS